MSTYLPESLENARESLRMFNDERINLNFVREELADTIGEALFEFEGSYHHSVSLEKRIKELEEQLAELRKEFR